MPGKGKFGIWPSKKDKTGPKEQPADTPGGKPTREGGLGGNVVEKSGAKGRPIIKRKDK